MSDLRRVWNGNASKFAQACGPGLGFSFEYDGRAIGPTLSDDWTVEDLSPDLGTGRLVLRHASGLVVIRETRVLTDFAAVEWKLRFKNEASATLPPITSLLALDIGFDRSIIHGNCVVSSGGGLADGYLPPRSFALRRSCFCASVEDRGVVYLTTEGGRSSNKDMPFFFVHNDDLNEGAYVAFGWSGQWQASVATHLPKDQVSIWGKIPDIEIALEPGEEIEGPTILVGFYRGDVSDGSNVLRRLIDEVYAPRLAGRPFAPVATYDHFWNVGDKFDEALLDQLAEGAASIGQEYFLLDAGWYDGDSWYASTGNWEETNRSRLPNGLKALADNVRSKGLKFGLWFEPERVARNTKLAVEHPDWVLWDFGAPPSLNQSPSPERLPGLAVAPYIADKLRRSNPEFFVECGLLNYGLPAVQRWVREMMSRYIEECGLEYIRYDFNTDPLPYWDANDTPGRRGVTQLRYIHGFYAVIDWLRDRHPGVVLEGCASGGRRLDLETVRRFHTAWISDHTVDPAIVRFHLHGINHFLPGRYAYVQYTLPSAYGDEDQADDLGFQSMFGGSFGTGGRVMDWPEEKKERARRHVHVWKRLRGFLDRDFYALSPQPSDVRSWSAWQFHDAKKDAGFFQTFRTRSSEATFRVFPRGLEASRTYHFEDAYSGEKVRLTGKAASSDGIEVSHPQMSSRVMIYGSEGA